MSQQNGLKLGWGVIGGARNNRRLIPGLKAASNAKLIAVASRDHAKAEAIAAKYGAVRSYGSYEALLADPEIQVVYIPLPNALHIEWAIKAAEAGKHALVEKPLALAIDDIIKLEQVVRKSGVLVMEAFMYRFHPQYTRVKMLIAEGVIGEVKALRGTFSFVLGSEDYNIRLDESMGGGATWDLGCYGINVARDIFNCEPKAIYAEANVRSGCAVETSVAAILDFSDGRYATLDYSYDYGRRAFYEVLGTKGTISIENIWQEADRSAFIYLRDDRGLHTEELQPSNHFQLEVESFNQAIINGQNPPYLEDAKANTIACVALLKSIKEGRRISV